MAQTTTKGIRGRIGGEGVPVCLKYSLQYRARERAVNQNKEL